LISWLGEGGVRIGLHAAGITAKAVLRPWKQEVQIEWVSVLKGSIKENDMPEKETLERARKDAAEGKSPSTQAGEFVREEIDHVREGKHGVRSAKQAIAIGLSKARRAGVKLPPPKGSAATRKKAAQDTRAAKSKRRPSTTRSRATEGALRRESRQGASRSALSRQAKRAAASRGSQSRKRAAQKAARTRKVA
jgi:hypothetical protein